MGRARWPLGRLGGVSAPTLIKKSGAKRPRGARDMSSAVFFQSGAAAGLPAGQPCNPAGLPSWQRSAALAAALLPRRAASGLPGRRCRAARMAAQGCQRGSAAALLAALLPRRAALLPRRAALPCGQPADSGASSGDNSRSWTGRALREGVPGCEGSLPSRGREPGRRIRWGHCPHPGACRRRHLRTCSGPSQPRVCFAVLSVRRVKGRGTRPAPNLAK